MKKKSALNRPCIPRHLKTGEVLGRCMSMGKKEV